MLIKNLFNDFKNLLIIIRIKYNEFIINLLFNVNTISNVYIKNLAFILLIDCALMDDEPLFEPLE